MALPLVQGGETAVIDVSELTVKLVAFLEPNLTAVAPFRYAPVIVTVVPPLDGPLSGETLATVGGGTMNAHAAPAPSWSVGPPISAVSPSEESATDSPK